MQKLKLQKHHIFILLIFTIMANPVAFAQNVDSITVKDSIQIDSSNIKVETIPWDKIENYKKNKDYDYNYKKRKVFDFWSRILNWIDEILEAIFSKKGVAPYLRLLFAVLVVALVIYLVLKADISGIFSRNKKVKNANGFDYFDEDIHSQDLDKKLNQAIAEADYRKAIRFYYLILLKQLDLSELIQWKMSKTNLEYQAELANHQILNDFKVLSGIYEYTWYGNFIVDQQHFGIWQSDFQLAIKQINQK